MSLIAVGLACAGMRGLPVAADPLAVSALLAGGVDQCRWLDILFELGSGSLESKSGGVE